MMRFARLVLLVMTFLPIAALAEDDGGPHRVGFVNVAEVLNKSPQVKKLEGELKESYETRKAELDKEQEKLNELERKLATEGEGMSFDDRSTLEHQILSMRSKLKQELTWLEEDITIRKSGETSRLIKLLREVIGEVAKEKKVDLVARIPGRSDALLEVPGELRFEASTDANIAAGGHGVTLVAGGAITDYNAEYVAIDMGDAAGQGPRAEAARRPHDDQGQGRDQPQALGQLARHHLHVGPAVHGLRAHPIQYRVDILETNGLDHYPGGLRGVGVFRHVVEKARSAAAGEGKHPVDVRLLL